MLEELGDQCATCGKELFQAQLLDTNAAETAITTAHAAVERTMIQSITTQYQKVPTHTQ